MSYPVIAAVLAGGEWPGDTPRGTSRWRAMTPLMGRPMLTYVLEALGSSEMITEIVVVGPPELSAQFPSISWLAGEDSLTETVMTSCRYAQGKGKILLVGCDIPLLTKDSLDSFIGECGFKRTQLYYPIIEKQVISKRYPTMKRTYVRLSDGIFTGGNMMLADPAFILATAPSIQALYDARKKPLALARILGFKLLFKYILTSKFHMKVLNRRKASRMVGKAVGGQVRAIPVLYPEIGADLDSPEDIPVFEALLFKRNEDNHKIRLT